MGRQGCCGAARVKAWVGGRRRRGHSIDSTVPISVLTLNLWNLSGPHAERRALIRRWIDELDPDLVAFQEAVWGSSYDQPADLGGAGYERAYGPTMRFWRDERFEFGNAALSRWPITDQEVVRLPGNDDGEVRVALSITVDAPVGPISFTVTHLNWRAHHGMVRERQVAAVADLVLRRRPRDGFPPILAGDFNAAPEATEIRFLTGLHAFDGRSVFFHDAWAVAGDGGPGVTWSHRNPYARMGLEPQARIDYIFVGYPQLDGTGYIERCRVVCDQGEDGVWPSDHLGVYAELRTDPDPERVRFLTALGSPLSEQES
jgi:endonuclease/exonuclease/phosphatase family metal-dependent hydrolase